MSAINPTIYLGATEEDPVGMQLLQDNGIDPINLTGCTNFKVRLRNIHQHSEVIGFDDDEITVTDEPLGKISIQQSDTDFTLPKDYEYFVNYDDPTGKEIRVPKKGTFTWLISEDF